MLIANAIRLAIYARRREIAIMRLVGASNWFIRWPFLLEGIIQGLVGAVIAIAILSVIRAAIEDNVKRLLAFLPTGLPSQSYWQLTFALVVTGIMIGAAGSALALRRFLRV